jgi:tRNA(Ile)-lysidine synthase
MSNRPLAFTAERLLHTLRSFPPVNAYIVGFSGGADSTALLHALSSISHKLDVPLTAVHINHGLHDDAGVWQLQVESFCHQNSIPLVCLNVDPHDNSGKGLEAEARFLRYQAISDLLKPGDCLLTAHHADDQAETLLLNLMRGSGVDGLSAMPESRPLGNGYLQRPMLQFQKEVLRDYLRDNDIEWTEDPSNQYLNHDRNLVRHQIIPLLEQRWPGVSKRLLLTRTAMSDARHLLERLADETLKQILIHPYVLDLTPSLLNDPELFKLTIRRWLKQSGATSIPAHRLETFYEQVHQASSMHKVSVHWSGWLLRLYKQRLWLHADQDFSPCTTVHWPAGCEQVDLGNDVGQIEFKPACKNDSESNPVNVTLPDGQFTVGPRTGKEDSGINMGGQHKSLKNLFQSAGIPPWLRDCIPLCKLNGELVSMGDWCHSDSFETWMSENHIGLRWKPRHPLLQFVLWEQHRDDNDLLTTM